jgi:hypothetical protein
MGVAVTVENYCLVEDFSEKLVPCPSQRAKELLSEAQYFFGTNFLKRLY